MRAGYHYRVLRNNSRLCDGGVAFEITIRAQKKRQLYP